MVCLLAHPPASLFPSSASAIGVAGAGLGALERLGLVDEDAEACGKGFGVFVGERLQDGFEEFRMIVAGHVCVRSWVC